MSLVYDDIICYFHDEYGSVIFRFNCEDNIKGTQQRRCFGNGQHTLFLLRKHGVVVGVHGLHLFRVPEDFQNVGAVGDGVVSDELKLRGVAQLEGVAQLPAQECNITVQRNEYRLLLQ